MPLDTPIVPAALALTAATCWGTGDFLGGQATRRSDSFRSVLIIYATGLGALLIAVAARGEALPSTTDLGWGALSGLCGMIGVGALFRGFATGRMGIVAPVSAVLAAVLPVVFNALTEGLPASLQMVGFGVAAIGIWLLSRPDRLSGRPKGLDMAVLAGLGFGGFFIALDYVGENTVLWPLISGRVAAIALMIAFALATRRPMSLDQLPLGLLTLAGILDIAGNLLFLVATQHGRLDVTAVLGSLYPAVTAILAQAIIKEHLTRSQRLGITAAVLAIALITV